MNNPLTIAGLSFGTEHEKIKRARMNGFVLFAVERYRAPNGRETVVKIASSNETRVIF